MRRQHDVPREQERGEGFSSRHAWLLFGFLVAMMATGAAMLIGAAWLADLMTPGTSYSSRRWDDTMSTAEFVDNFPAHELAPRTSTDANGASLEQLFACYQEIGYYNAPPVRKWLDDLGREPLAWDAPLPRIYRPAEFDLTGKQLRPYVYRHGSGEYVVFAGFDCPINAAVR